MARKGKKRVKKGKTTTFKTEAQPWPITYAKESNANVMSEKSAFPQDKRAGISFAAWLKKYAKEIIIAVIVGIITALLLPKLMEFFYPEERTPLNEMFIQIDSPQLLINDQFLQIEYGFENLHKKNIKLLSSKEEILFKRYSVYDTIILKEARTSPEFQSFQTVLRGGQLSNRFGTRGNVFIFPGDAERLLTGGLSVYFWGQLLYINPESKDTCKYEWLSEVLNKGSLLLGESNSLYRRVQ